jgi:hypothetical protein
MSIVKKIFIEIFCNGVIFEKQCVKAPPGAFFFLGLPVGTVLG